MENVPQWLINWVLVGISSCGGWFLKGLFEAQKGLTDKVHLIEVDMAKNYVPNIRYDEMVKALFAKLDRIEDKIGGKADKPTAGHD